MNIYGCLLIPVVLVLSPIGALAASVTVQDGPGVETLLEPETDIFSPIPDRAGGEGTGIFALPMDSPGLGKRPVVTDPMRSVRPKSEWARPGNDEERAHSLD